MKAASQVNDVNQLNNNDNSNVKVKLPSWTDRILWKSMNSKVNQIQYSCINTITISDHKPVYALFDVEIKKIDDKKYNKIYERLLKETDKRYNEEMPRISIDKFEFNFGDCLFYDQKSCYLIVKNDGLTRTNVDIQFYDPKLISTNDELDGLQQTNSQHYAYKSNQWVTIDPQHKEKLG
jgi:hypothetical protein